MLLGEYSVRTEKTPQQHKSTYTIDTRHSHRGSESGPASSLSGPQPLIRRWSDQSERRRVVEGGAMSVMSAGWGRTRQGSKAGKIRVRTGREKCDRLRWEQKRRGRAKEKMVLRLLSDFRSLEMFLRWKNDVFVTLEIWFSKHRLLSNITPRFVTVEEVTVHPSRCKLWSKRFCVLFLGPISNISVLSEFNRRKLLVIQSFIFLTHSVSLDSLEVSSGFVEIYSWVSSA